MISYNSRTYYDKSKEPFHDPEWEQAEQAEEKPIYYWMGRCVKQYKPSIAKLVMKRTGAKLVPVNEVSE